MGCGVSKIDASGATTLPAKLRPVFLRRLEEIKKSRHAQPLKDSKELLLHDIDEEENASHFSSSEYDKSKKVPLPTKDGTDPSRNESLPTRNSANSVGKFESSKGKDPTKPAGKASNESEAAKCDDNKCSTKYEMLAEFSPKIKVANESKKPETKGDKTKIEGKIATIPTDKHGSEDEDGEHDKERMISHQDDDAFPGSPSFRIYFTDGMDDDQIDNNRTRPQRPSREEGSEERKKNPELSKGVAKGRANDSHESVECEVLLLITLSPCPCPSSRSKNSLICDTHDFNV